MKKIDLESEMLFDENLACILKCKSENSDFFEFL